MWNVESNIIQLELSTKLLKDYSTFSGNNAKKLLDQIGKLRNHLAQKNILLPYINIREEVSLPGNVYVIYFGAFWEIKDSTKDNIVEVLAQLASQYSISDFSCENVMRQFNTGLSELETGDYQKAIYSFAYTYYCSSFDKQNASIMVNSLLNICGIQMINNQFDSALQYGLRACFLVKDDDFYNPYLKYYSEYQTGMILVHKKRFNEALEHFIQAYRHINGLDVSHLSIAALSAIVQLNMIQKHYYNGAKTIDVILDIIQRKHLSDIDNDTIINLAQLQSQLCFAVIEKMECDFAELQQRCIKLSHSLLYRVFDATLNIIQTYGGGILNFALGSFLSGTYQFAFDNGTNTINNGSLVNNNGKLIIQNLEN